jgi:hypothetical protein
MFEVLAVLAAMVLLTRWSISLIRLVTLGMVATMSAADRVLQPIGRALRWPILIALAALVAAAIIGG